MVLSEFDEDPFPTDSGLGSRVWTSHAFWTQADSNLGNTNEQKDSPDIPLDMSLSHTKTDIHIYITIRFLGNTWDKNFGRTLMCKRKTQGIEKLFVPISSSRTNNKQLNQFVCTLFTVWSNNQMISMQAGQTRQQVMGRKARKQFPFWGVVEGIHVILRTTLKHNKLCLFNQLWLLWLIHSFRSWCWASHGESLQVLYNLSSYSASQKGRKHLIWVWHVSRMKRHQVIVPMGLGVAGPLDENRFLTCRTRPSSLLPDADLRSAGMARSHERIPAVPWLSYRCEHLKASPKLVLKRGRNSILETGKHFFSALIRFLMVWQACHFSTLPWTWPQDRWIWWIRGV